VKPKIIFISHDGSLVINKVKKRILKILGKRVYIFKGENRKGCSNATFSFLTSKQKYDSIACQRTYSLKTIPHTPFNLLEQEKL
jgi:hypothetical protein